MDLPTRFQQASTSCVVRMESLVLNKECSILRSERVTNKFGTIVMLSIRDSPDYISKIILPNPYAIIFTDEDLADINSDRKWYTLVYRGKSEDSKFHILETVNKNEIHHLGNRVRTLFHFYRWTLLANLRRHQLAMF